MLGRFRAPAGALVAQLFFIAAGVYLGNRADGWKEEHEHRRAARAALVNFRTEFAANRDRVRRVAAIHAAYADSMRVSQARGDPPPRSVRDVFRRLGWRGVAHITFGHTAWDLALATQALSYLPPPVAFRIARVYTAQQSIADLQRQASGALFNPAAMDDARVFAWQLSFGAFIEDMRLAEPEMLAGYDRMIPAVDSAIARLPE